MSSRLRDIIAVTCGIAALFTIYRFFSEIVSFVWSHILIIIAVTASCWLYYLHLKGKVNREIDRWFAEEEKIQEEGGELPPTYQGKFSLRKMQHFLFKRAVGQENETDRIKSFRALPRVKIRMGRTAPFLICRLKEDQNPRIRAAAATALEATGNKEKEVKETLLAALRDQEPVVGKAAVAALQSFPELEVLRSLSALLFAHRQDQFFLSDILETISIITQAEKYHEAIEPLKCLLEPGIPLEVAKKALPVLEFLGTSGTIKSVQDTRNFQANDPVYQEITHSYEKLILQEQSHA